MEPSEARQLGPGGQPAAEDEDPETAHPPRVEESRQRAPEVDRVLEVGAVAAEDRGREVARPERRDELALGRLADGLEAGRAAAARTAARSTVAVRSWRPTWRNGSPPTAWRANARSVPVGRFTGWWRAAGSSA